MRPFVFAIVLALAFTAVPVASAHPHHHEATTWYTVGRPWMGGLDFVTPPTLTINTVEPHGTITGAAMELVTREFAPVTACHGTDLVVKVCFGPVVGVLVAPGQGDVRSAGLYVHAVYVSPSLEFGTGTYGLAAIALS